MRPPCPGRRRFRSRPDCGHCCFSCSRWRFYWLLGVHLVSRVSSWTERRYGKGDIFLSVGARLQAFKYFLLALLGVYYITYTTIGWEDAVKWLPILKPASEWFWWLASFVLLWLLIMTLPGRFLAWMRDKVVALKAKLPKKYDPTEDRPVAYLSYHTPGDEARVHLRLFGALTWLVQTLGLSAACVLAAGVALTVVIGVEVLSSFLLGGSIMSRLGISAWQAEPVELRDRFVALMNWLTYFPSIVWTKLFDLKTTLDLSGVENPRDVAWYIPLALLAAVSLLSFVLMPVVLILVGAAYAVSIRLRGPWPTVLVSGGAPTTTPGCGSFSSAPRLGAARNWRTATTTRATR